MMKQNGLRTGDLSPNGHSNDHEAPQPMEQTSSVAEIRATLAKLKEKEAFVTLRLNGLVASQKDLSRELGKLDLIRAQLGTQAVATRAISNNMLSDAASTAKRISGAVQRLDLEQARVKSTLEVVEQVAELKACVLGVTGSMGAPQDWETAAGYLSRASKVPREIICGSFAEEIVPSVEVPDAPVITLENAAESLCGLFLREFEKATKEDNGPKVTRFFKLFPLIGRPEVGLNVYGRYVCQGVASHARANLNAGTGGAQRKEGFFYAGALTKLFEYIAQIIDRHGGLVERHYGEGRMVKVIERLQVEADVQGGIVIDTWSDERSIERRLTDIRSYAFTFLVQSFLPPQNTRNPISRTNSPAVHDRSAVNQQDEDDGSDMKDVDGFLSEIAIMLGRWSLYCRFIATKCSDRKMLEAPDAVLTLPPLLLHSSLIKKVADKLILPFNQMTTFYFRRSVEKAFQLDEQPSDLSLNMNKIISSNAPYISSAVDDVMYIVNQVIQRSLATSQRDVVASALPGIGRVLSNDFVGMIQRKMRDESYPRPAVQGGLPTEQIIVAFIVLANDLDVATDYIKRIVTSKLDSPSKASDSQASSATATPHRHLHDSYPFAHDSTFVTNSLQSLQTTFIQKTTELLTDGIYVLFKNVLKPRLRPILADAFRDVDYTLSPEELEDLAREAELADGGDGANFDDADGALNPVAAAALPDAVPRRFRQGWEALSRPLARICTAANWDRLLAQAAGYLAELLEKRLWGYYGRVTALGAVRLERDVAAVVRLVIADARYALRDSFARCSQIVLVANMEEDEWEELGRDGSGVGGKGLAGNGDGDDGVQWTIDTDERERARGLVRAG